MKFLKLAVNVLAIICYVFIGAYVFVSAPLVMGYHPMVVLSGSMEPACPVGSIIYTKDIPPEEIKVKDIVTFKVSGNTLITHRVVAKNEINKTFTTKGDANKIIDPEKLSYNDVVGRVVDYKLPYVGFYINYINTHLYLAIILVVILLSKIILSFAEPENDSTVNDGEEKVTAQVITG